MARSRRQPRVVAAIILLMGVLVLAFAGVIGAVVDEAPRQPSTTTIATSSTTSTTLVPLSEFGDPGEELEALVANGRTVRVHAVYSVDDPQLPDDLVQTLEVWRDGDAYRSDIIERAGDTVRRQTTIVTAQSAVACETVQGEETCRVATTIPSDLPQAFIAALAREDERPRLTVTDGDVAGFVARCFAFDGEEDDGELCLAEDGVMLSVKLQEATLVATTVEDVVPESAFNKPGVVR
jgi:hypothetical protein